MRFQKYGIVTTVIDGVIKVVGLDTASCGEKMLIGVEQHPALVLNLEKKVTKAILLVEDTKIRVGDIASNFTNGSLFNLICLKWQFILMCVQLCNTFCNKCRSKQVCIFYEKE